MIELRLQKMSDPNSFAYLYQLTAVVDEDGKLFAKVLTFSDIGDRSDLVEGLLKLAAAVEAHK